MFTLASSPVTEITFGQGMQISLNNYYDLLKAQAGSLGADEFLQLMVAANGIDISEKKNADGGYEWFSYYNLLNKCDLEIYPQPVSGNVLTGVERLSNIYGDFLNKLSQFVKPSELSPEDLQEKADLEVQIDAIKTQIGAYSEADFLAWKNYCELRNINITDGSLYLQWADTMGHGREIQNLVKNKNQKNIRITQIINKTYANPDDKEIMDALSLYLQPSMQMAYPRIEDYMYTPPPSLTYLMSIPPYSVPGQYDLRYIITFDKGLDFLKKSSIGAISATFERSTSNSSSISTDWGHSGNVRYAFISVNSNVNDSRAIQEDFQKAISIQLKSKATIRVGINYGPWFRPELFNSSYVVNNIELFQEFFGPSGSLLYYPTDMILIRGFGIEFISSSNWTYDYKRNFSASLGGGFKIFGVNFGGTTNYSKNVKEHQIDKTGTTLTIGDDENTLRFVGYILKKNTVMEDRITANINSLGLTNLI